jgi:hypothetical protein
MHSLPKYLSSQPALQPFLHKLHSTRISYYPTHFYSSPSICYRVRSKYMYLGQHISGVSATASIYRAGLPQDISTNRTHPIKQPLRPHGLDCNPVGLWSQQGWDSPCLANQSSSYHMQLANGFRPFATSLPTPNSQSRLSTHTQTVCGGSTIEFSSRRRRCIGRVVRFTDSKIQAINQYRLYLQVECLSEICTADGVSLDPGIQAKPSTLITSTSMIKRPCQRFLGRRSWKI